MISGILSIDIIAKTENKFIIKWPHSMDNLSQLVVLDSSSCNPSDPESPCSVL